QVTALIPYDDPKIASVTGLWRAANFHEREAWDLMGVEYEGHPNLERILLPTDFKFHAPEGLRPGGRPPVHHPAEAPRRDVSAGVLDQHGAATPDDARPLEHESEGGRR